MLFEGNNEIAVPIFDNDSCDLAWRFCGAYYKETTLSKGAGEEHAGYFIDCPRRFDYIKGKGKYVLKADGKDVAAFLKAKNNVEFFRKEKGGEIPDSELFMEMSILISLGNIAV